MRTLIKEIHIDVLNKLGEIVPGYTAAVWRFHDRTLFGLRYYNGYTHMSYRLEDLVDNLPVLEYLGGQQSNRFYFDAGSSGRPLYCTKDEMERVLRGLKLIGDNVTKTSDSILGPDPDPINLDQYIQELRSNVDKFERWHKHNRDIHPEQFDDEMYSGEWEEQFVTWMSIGAPDAT